MLLYLEGALKLERAGLDYLKVVMDSILDLVLWLHKIWRTRLDQLMNEPIQNYYYRKK